MAEGLVRKQAANDLQHYNERFDSARQSIDRLNELQTGRKEADLPPAPTLEPGGDPDLWRASPIEITGPSEKLLVDGLPQKMQDKLRKDAGL